MNRSDKSFVGELTEARTQMRRLTRRSFAVGGAAALAGAAGLAWLHSAALEDGTPWPLRRMLEFNERVANGLFNPGRSAPEFPKSRAQAPRTNGDLGMAAPLDPATWRLNAVTEAVGAQPLQFTLDEVRRLPRIEMTTELKCIEGWSVIVNWAGARLRDFAAQYRLATRDGRPLERAEAKDSLRYVGLETPDVGYYVGLDMAAALHPQTLLCYEMNGQPLPPEHGAPLRLVISVKYGIKHLKRIGRIFFTDSRPRDYWAEQGYDWYAGH